MVAIPLSSGPRNSPQASAASVAPINPGQVSSAVANLGQTGVQLAAQRIQFETHRNEALQAAKALDYSTQVRDIDNQIELQAQQTASTPDKFQGLTAKLGADRQKRIDELLSKEQDPVVRDLALRSANASGVEVKDKLNRYQLGKEAEYGQHVITTKLDALGDQLANTSDPRAINSIKAQVNETLKTGLASRYIDYNFIDSYHDKVKRIAAARQAEAAQGQALNAYLDGRAFADPNSAKDQKIVSNAFNKAILSNDPNLINTAVNLSAKTGIVPSQLVSSVSGRMTTGNSNQKVQAAQIVATLVKENPRLIRAFPESVQSQALTINRSIEAGVAPQQAVEFAEKDMKENQSFDRDRRQQQYQQDNSTKIREAKFKTLQQELSDQGFFRKDAVVPDSIFGQHEFLTKQFYMNNGESYENAFAHATDVVKSQWRPTNIGAKKVLQRYSPESQYYVPGQPDTWIKDQLIDELSGKPDVIKKPTGLVESGNIDLLKRPAVKNADGSISTLRSITIEEDGKMVLIPTIQDGKQMTQTQAINYYRKTGQNLGKFQSADDADAYARRVSQFEGQVHAKGEKSSFLGSGKFLADTIEKPNYFPGKSKDEINDSVELAVIPDTVESGSPEYFIMHQVDEYGRKGLVLDEKNQPVRFKPDFSKTEAYKNSIAAREALNSSPEEFAQKLYEKNKEIDLNKGGGFNHYIPPAVDKFNRRGFKNEPYSGGGL